MERFLLALAAGWLLLLVLHRFFVRRRAARAAVAVDDERVTKLTDFIQTSLDTQEVRDAGLILVARGQTLCERSFGHFSPVLRVPVASAAKWISTAVIMTLVDERLLDLDEPVVHLLPEMRGRKSVITLRQLLSCTAGLPSRVAWLKSPQLTLAENVARIAAEPLVAEPGTQFVYGGVGFQIAGYLAELVSGQQWQQLFERRIKRPLGMSHTRYGFLDRRDMRFDASSSLNPHIGGGVESTARDYAKFVTMLAAGGQFKGRQILSQQAATEMLREQTGAAHVAHSNHWNRDAGYCLGGWVDRQDREGRTTQVSCPGSLGWYPWVDLQRGYGGVFGIRHEARRLSRVYPRVTELSADLVTGIM